MRPVLALAILLAVPALATAGVVYATSTTDVEAEWTSPGFRATVVACSSAEGVLSFVARHVGGASVPVVARTPLTLHGVSGCLWRATASATFAWGGLSTECVAADALLGPPDEFAGAAPIGFDQDAACVPG